MEEQFETFAEDGSPTGLVPRSRVHAEGLWHRAVHVWLFAPDGGVWLQRRAPDKDLNPGLWDVSVGEHLKPGESWLEAAVRGLHEELGVEPAPALEPLGGVWHFSLDRPELGVHDHELQQAFRGVHPGPLRPDPVELAEVRLLEPDTLRAWLEAEPGAFAPSCHADIARLRLLDPGP